MIFSFPFLCFFEDFAGLDLVLDLSLVGWALLDRGIGSLDAH